MCFKVVSRKFQGCSKKVFKVLHGSFRVLKESFKGVEGRLKGVSIKF